jgi:hypothetical protein
MLNRTNIDLAAFDNIINKRENDHTPVYECCPIHEIHGWSRNLWEKAHYPDQAQESNRERVDRKTVPTKAELSAHQRLSLPTLHANAGYRYDIRR